MALQNVSAASYSEFVKLQMSRAEAILKVILSPTDSVADTYSALCPKGTPTKLQRIVDLKFLTIHDSTRQSNEELISQTQSSIKELFLQSSPGKMDEMPRIRSTRHRATRAARERYDHATHTIFHV
ncbi:hypothetical protein ISN44_As06g044260 [Arabidopsis suecica]|uniref:Uncharacterized protein n=1 Tax=Arabidopsis suecica TaxID=45249 RepID=A0A8T2CL89_ARASU|nr:hypothetical protein ISN44_As06g044260 [Arabidopsis suecica]